MALSDAEVDPKELAMLYRIGEEKGVSKAEIDEVVIRPDKIKFTSPKTLFEKIECLYDIAKIAWADGKIDENELHVLQMFCKKFGFEIENIPAIVQFLLDQAVKGTSTEDVMKIVSENM